MRHSIFEESLWRTSSRSAPSGSCVEVAVTNTAVGIRDSKDRAGGVHVVSRQQWAQFLRTVCSGQIAA